jgi:uracil-DNA glycosylase family protein
LSRTPGTDTSKEPADARPFVPERPDGRPASLETLSEAAAGCRGCHLWQPATQTVFGEGPEGARIVLVGEQPGDREDREGRPFVGPAGRELDRGLVEAGIDRGEVYVTNVVKHFKFEERGKRRIHQTPRQIEIKACRPWLEEELELLAPEAVVALGAVAAKALFGASFRVSRERGKLLESELAPVASATIHPSSILRTRDEEARHAEREAFAADLAFVGRAVSSAPSR